MLKVFAAILFILLVSMFVFAGSKHSAPATNEVIIVYTQPVPAKKTPVEIVDAINQNIATVISKSKDKKEIECLANNVFYESRNQSVIGKIAVAHVTLNRSKDQDRTICKIVYQKSKNGCQFSWVCGGKKSDKNIIEAKAWKEALAVSYAAFTGLVEDPTDGATFYYNPKRAHPHWAKHKKIVKTSYTKNGYIGEHLFLRDY
jgi:spore germination cell wall hydrolase CwlJ-like protein